MSEEAESRRDNSKLTKNSGRGSTKGEKGDARLPADKPVVTIDYTEYPKSFTINEDFWAKICTDAQYNGDVAGVLKLIMGYGEQKTRLFVVDEDMFHQMFEAWFEKHGEYL